MNDTNLFNKFLLIVICVIIGFVAGVITHHKYECNISTPVEKSDTLL